MQDVIGAYKISCMQTREQSMIVNRKNAASVQSYSAIIDP
jgi:hypothetical protein